MSRGEGERDAGLCYALARHMDNPVPVLPAGGVLPLDPTEARKKKKNSSKFTLIDGELYRFGFTHPLLECVHGEKCTRIMAELYEGICASHIGGRALAARTLRVGYYLM